jgi:Flp pilus assembly protein TadB
MDLQPISQLDASHVSAAKPKAFPWLLLIACLLTGCGSPSDYVQRQAEIAVQKQLAEARIQAEQKSKELQDKLDQAQERLSKIESDNSMRHASETLAARWFLMFIYILGVLAFIKLCGRPILRACASIALRCATPPPRRIM